MPGSALVFEVSVLDVRLHKFGKLFLFHFLLGGRGLSLLFFSISVFKYKWVTLSFFLVFFATVSVWLSDGLRSVSGFQVASWWFTLTPVVLFFNIASGWLARCQWVAYADFISFIYSASGWFARGQWVAYADFYSFFFCQWVACA